MTAEQTELRRIQAIYQLTGLVRKEDAGWLMGTLRTYMTYSGDLRAENDAIRKAYHEVTCESAVKCICGEYNE